MEDRKEAVEELRLNSPTKPRPSGGFTPTQAQPYAAVQRNAPADVRLLSPPFAPVAKKQWHEQYRHQNQPHATAPLGQLEIAEPRRNIVVQAAPLPPTLDNTGVRAGGTWPATGAPTQATSQPPLRAVFATSAPPLPGVVGMSPTIAAVPAVGGEGQERLPSWQVVDGGIAVLGGQPVGDSENMGGALTCVLMYMTIVVVAIAMVLVYFFRSLYAEPPKMTPFDYEEEEVKQTRKKPLKTTVWYEEEHPATRPLRFARRDKGRGVTTTHGPETRDADGGGTGRLVTSDTGYADEVGGREDRNITAVPNRHVALTKSNSLLRS
ncbi:hypothetical protein MTO96_048976 [Rhipicephalus appendiculatus]